MSWLASAENWKKSCGYLTACNKSGTRRVGIKRWMTMAEMITKLGEKTAAAIAEYKLSQPDVMEEEVRWHPDAPNCEARMGTVYMYAIAWNS